MRKWTSALAIDLDGTLLSSDRTIAPSTLRAIRDLADSGYLVIVSTARPVRAVKALTPEWFDEFYWAICGGAWIVHGGQVLHRSEIPYGDAVQLVSRFVDRGIRAQVEADDTLYSDAEIPSGYIGGRRPLQDYPRIDACKVIAFVDSEAEIDEVRKLLPHRLSMVVTDGGTLIQIAPKDCSKLTAVQTILTEQGLHLQDLIAFGDDNNDIELLDAAGCAVAVANATAALQKVADYVTGSNDEDGVGEVLQMLLDGAALDRVGSAGEGNSAFRDWVRARTVKPS